MQARYPQHIVILVEDLVAAADTDAIVSWMAERAMGLRLAAEVPHALVYASQKSSGTLGRPRFMTVFETADPGVTYETLAKPYAHEALRPLGLGAYEYLPGLPQASRAEPSGGLMVGMTNCTDPSQEESFNAWYDAVHAADVVRSPWFWNTQRYRKVFGDLPQYAALYETSLQGSEAMAQYLRWPERVSDMHPCIANVHVWSFDQTAAEL
jgi:hypothetical protein